MPESPAITSDQCADVQHRMNCANEGLIKWQRILDNLRLNTNSEPDFSAITAARDSVLDFQARLRELRAEQQRLGCSVQSSTTISLDNQTVIASSSVRRKDSAALIKVEMPDQYNSKA